MLILANFSISSYLALIIPVKLSFHARVSLFKILNSLNRVFKRLKIPPECHESILHHLKSSLKFYFPSSHKKPTGFLVQNGFFQAQFKSHLDLPKNTCSGLSHQCHIPGANFCLRVSIVIKEKKWPKETWMDVTTFFFNTYYHAYTYPLVYSFSIVKITFSYAR